MSALEDKAADLLGKFETLAEQYSPIIIDAALNVVRISAAGYLIVGGISAYVAFLLWQWGLKERNRGEEEATFFICVLALVVSILSAIFLLDIWNWVTIFYPELGLAHKVLGL